MVNPPEQRLRITFGKVGSQKYIGHLDLAKTWERILRRAEIALSYSQGFKARPKMQLAAALPLGITSECELIDVWLDFALPVEGLPEHLMAVSPPGLPIHHINEVPIKSPALQSLCVSAIYVMTPLEAVDVSVLKDRAQVLMAQPEVLRVRRDKPYDLRPLVLSLEINEQGQIRTEMVLREQAAGRPDELTDALGIKANEFVVHRQQIRLREIAD